MSAAGQQSVLAQIRGSNPYEILNDLLVPTCAGDDGKGSVDECPMYVQRLNQCMFRDCCKRLSRNVSTELALVSGVQDCDRPDWPIPKETPPSPPSPPPSPPATTPAPSPFDAVPEPCPPGRCVEFVISLPITEDQFTLEYQNTFRGAIAKAAEVPVSAVQITSIQVANSLRRRRLLQDKIQIAVEVTTDDYETAVQVSERLTQDRINQELREAGLDEGLLVKKAKVALSLEADSGGRGSTTLLTVLLVAAISCSIIAGAILGYCWRRRKMQELAGMHDGFDLVKDSPTKQLESKGGAEVREGTSAKYGAGVGVAEAAKVAGRRNAGADDGKEDAKAAGGSPGDGWGTKLASEPIMVDEDGFESAHTCTSRKYPCATTQTAWLMFGPSICAKAALNRSNARRFGGVTLHPGPLAQICC